MNTGRHWFNVIESNALPKSLSLPPINLPWDDMKRQTLALLVVLVGASLVQAQLPQTRLYALSRAGGQAGTEFDVTILSGADLDEVDGLLFNHPEITAEQKKDGNGNPVTNAFAVKVGPNVPVGAYEARCRGLFGVSNPRRFMVSHRAEVMENTDNNSPDKATPIELGQIVNARLEAGNDVDWYRIDAQAGMKIVLDCFAERIDSKMDPVLAVYDETGRRRLAYSRNTTGLDEVFVFEPERSGVFLIKVNDQIFRNGNEYIYRLLIHTDPHIAIAFPPVGAGKVTLHGFNLPGSSKTDQELFGAPLETLEVSVQAPAEKDLLDVDQRVSPVAAALDAFDYRLEHNGVSSNPVTLGITELPVATEVEPNDTAEQAQAITVPADVSGQFSKVEDNDVFRFEAKAGQVFYVEVLGQRLGRPVDPFLIVDRVTKKEDGTETFQRLTAQDDIATNLQQNVFETKTDDAIYRLEVGADSLYQVTVRDRYWESRGNPSLLYRLIIREETPDFRLVALPTSPTAGQSWPVGLRKGDHFPVTVYAFRQDGYQGPIRVTADVLPAGVTCPPAVIGTNETTTQMVITTTADAQAGWHQFNLIGTATVKSPQIQRQIAATQKDLEAKRKPIPDLEKARNQAQAQVDEQAPKVAELTKQKAEKPEDEGVAKQLAQAEEELNKRKAGLDQANQNLAAAQQTLSQAEQQLTALQQQLEQQKREVKHAARSATVVWDTAANVPAITRLTSPMYLSIMDEQAPYQLMTDVQEVEVNQGRQVLISTKLEKRNGFDEKVALTVAGLPKNSNIDFKNDAIEKGQTEKVLAMYIKDNVNPGTYSVWLNSQGQVAYSRNPQKVERLKQKHEEVQAQVEEAKKQVQAATQAKTEAVNKFNQLTQMVQQAQQQLQQKQQEFKAYGAQVQAAEKALQAAGQAKNTAEQQHKQAAATSAASKKQHDDLVAKKAQLETAQKQAIQAKFGTPEQIAARKQDVDKSKEVVELLSKLIQLTPDDKELQAKLEQAKAELATKSKPEAEYMALLAQQAQELKAADAEIAKAKEAFDKQTQAEVAAKQQLDQTIKAQQDAQQQLAQTQTKATELQKAETDAATALQNVTAQHKAAEAAKAKAEADEKARNDAVANIEKQRQAAEKAFKDAETAAKPKNVNFTPPTAPIVVHVKPAPIKLTATAPDGGKVKKGAMTEVTVKVTRQNGFAGPVKVSLPAVPGVQGVSAPEVEIPADATEAKLTVAASGDATEGALANLVVRGTAEFEGKAAVDAPVTINVTK